MSWCAFSSWENQTIFRSLKTVEIISNVKEKIIRTQLNSSHFILLNQQPPVGESSIPTVLEATEATTITFNVQTREAENSTKMSNVSTISHVVGISDSISTTESQSNNSQTTISEDNFVNLGRKSGLVRNNFTSKESPEITTNNPTTNDGEAPSTTETTSGLSVAVSDRAENVSRVAFGPNVVESTSPANITSQTRRINSKYHELSTLNSKNLSHSSLFLNCTKTKLKVVQEKSALKVGNVIRESW